MPSKSDSAARDELAVRVARLLAAGDHGGALELADRLCRLRSSDDPSHLTLLALAAARAGRSSIAAASLDRARRSDPNHLFAARAGMDILHGDARNAAARTVLRLDDSDTSLRKAAAILLMRNEPKIVLGVEGGTVRIRALARSAEPIFELEGDGVAVHRHLAVPGGRMDEWGFERPVGPARARIRIPLENGRTFQRAFAVALDPAHGFARGPRITGGAKVLNIVVPIYDDLDATAACLQSLERQASDGFSIRIILVDDNSPSPSISALAASYAGRDGYVVLRNAENLGFTGAVNKGLSHCQNGDVLLLNADTVLPRDALDRLFETAEAHPDVGTLTPFSNNGQYVSFPKPFEVNPLPGDDDLERLSQAAWQANGTSVCDIPSGIGFCLFVREACMAACHRLGEQFDKGYYEDVDLCLRAENLGWRNACATGVFVGHHGSRSFGDEKAILAARNRSVLDRTYPLFGKRGATWLEADPLFPFRARIEARLPSPAGPTMLLLAGDETSRWRGERLQEDGTKAGERVLLAELGEREGAAALLVRAADGVPQSLALFLREGETGTLADFLRREGVVRAVILDPAGFETWLLDALAEVASVEFDEGDAGSFCPRRSLVRADGRHCGMPDDPSVCDACVQTGGAASASAIENGVADWRRRLAGLVFGSEDVPRSAYLGRFARLEAMGTAASDRPLVSAEEPGSSIARTAPRLALLPLFASALETRLLHELCEHLSARHIDTLVVGSTLNDESLLALPNVFVTGPVAASDLRDVARIYGITHAMLASRRFASGHPLARASSWLDLPIARFAFPFADRSATAGGLAIPVEVEACDVALSLAKWVEAREVETSASISGAK